VGAGGGLGLLLIQHLPHFGSQARLFTGASLARLGRLPTYFTLDITEYVLPICVDENDLINE
jgi:hypothetical protein